jgi:hypothetical protein
MSVGIDELHRTVYWTGFSLCRLITGHFKRLALLNQGQVLNQGEV